MSPRRPGWRCTSLPSSASTRQAILKWIGRLRDFGVEYPVRIGFPGPTNLATLLRYARRCGVRASAQGLARQAGLVRQLFAMSTPDILVRTIAEARAHRHLGEIAPHFFSFGGLAQAARWGAAVAERRIALEPSDGFRVEPPPATGPEAAERAARHAGLNAGRYPFKPRRRAADEAVHRNGSSLGLFHHEIGGARPSSFHRRLRRRMRGRLAPRPARANVPVGYDWNAAPPTDPKSDFINWMIKNRGEDPAFLGQRWDRFKQLLASRDIWDKRDIRAYLLTPREEFVTRPISAVPMNGIISISAMA